MRIQLWNIVFLIGFIVLALIQWYVPVSGILNWEQVLDEGETYRFVTEPVDPTDLFRGKYVYLSFREREVTITEGNQYAPGADVYLTLGTDSLGYALFTSNSAVPPSDGKPYITAKAGWTRDSVVLNLYLPFDTYYMEESKASDAESVYEEAVTDSTQVAYAVVKVLNGKSVLQDVMINEKPILEVVEEMRRAKGRK